MYSIAGLVNISRELIWLLLCKTAALMLSGVIRRTISHKIRDIEPGLAGVLSWFKRSIDLLSCQVTSSFSIKWHLQFQLGTFVELKFPDGSLLEVQS
jgi:hypothetical protein